MEEQPFPTLTRGEESNPARVLWQSVARLKNIYLQILKLNGFFLSIETDVPPDRIDLELN
jgi:hypothetical protein